MTDEELKKAIAEQKEDIEERKNMEDKTFDAYIKKSWSELCHEYQMRYNIRWPDRPENTEIDEKLFEAISWKLRQGK